MSASAKINLSVDASVGGSPDLGSAIHAFVETFSQSFSNGTGAGLISQVFSDIRTLALSSSEDLDLAGSLVNGLGATVTFTAIKGIVVLADAANGGNIEVGGAVSNGFINWVGDATDQIVVEPGGCFALFTPSAGGYAVTAGTGDLLAIANTDGAASANYTLILLGIE